MTGLHPRRHGAGAVVDGHDALSRSGLVAEATTLAETFRRRGYRTQAVVTNPYLFPRFGLAAGYEGYDNLTYLSEYMLGARATAGQWLLDRLAPSLTVGDRGVEVSDRAIAWLRAVDPDAQQPFFLWLHYIDPHGPYEATPSSGRKSFREEMLFGDLAGTDHGMRSPSPVRLRSGEIRLDEKGKAAVRDLYRAEIREADRQVGRVLRALEEHGLDQRTLIVCVSDHGEEFWEHGGVEHGHTLYDEVLRAVWIMKWPEGLPAGERIDRVVSMVDVAPTMQDLVFGVADPVDGVSLLPLLRGETVEPRTAFAENLLFAEERVAIRTYDAKLVRWSNGKEEAYDLRRDPGEQRDLVALEPFVEPLRVALRASSAPTVVATTPAVVDGAALRALRALGYVQ
jgi:arylsulfatase